jgi:hypothetical protein
MRKQNKLSWALAAFLLCSHSYSFETVYGQSNVNARNWVMQNVLPQQAGLTISHIVYEYGVIKETQDAMLVHVQNEDAINGGYIFRSTDDWTGQPSNVVKKIKPASQLPIEYWGPGSIEVEGKGTVVDPSVKYNWRYVPCFDPQSDPECPGYRIPYDLDKILAQPDDPLEEQYVQEQLERQAELEEEEEFERKERLKKNKRDMEKLLGGINTQLMSDLALATEAAYFSVNLFPTSYYNPLEGGTYEDALQLIDAELPDNKAGKRVNYTQQKLHEEMIQSQYDN